jgi:hypothetical protein
MSIFDTIAAIQQGNPLPVLEQGPSVLGTSMNPQMGQQFQSPPGFFQNLGQAYKGLEGNYNNPLMQFGLNMLANSGAAPYGTTFGQRLGQAGGQTLQQINQNKLMEAQMKLMQARTEQAGSIGQTNSNVQSTFEGDNGNIWIVTRDAKTVDTGVPFRENLEFFEQADGSVVGVDRATGQRLGTVVTPEEASAAATRKSQTEATQQLPSELASLDGMINKADRTIEKVVDVLPLVKDGTTGVMQAVRGGLPGALGGDPRQLRQAVKSLQANFGFDTLQQMRAASKTGGALGQVSERELDLLVNALESIDIEGDDEVLLENLNKVIEHYENYKSEIERMKNAMREQAGQPTSQDEFAGFSIKR